jgi:serine protease DegQ
MVNWRTLLLLICVGSFSIFLPTQISQIKALIGQAPIQLSAPQLSQRARSITVKINSEEFLGSGILIYKRDSVYTVLTNDHVLKAGKAPYKIKTADGKIHEAQKISPSKSLQGNDLGLLEFTAAETDYPVAKLGKTPTPETHIRAAGFPFSPQEKPGFEHFVIRSGQIKWVLDKALEGGYKIGYTNEVEKGMSGGPVINLAGELIGINGVHAHPIWGDPYLFQDGSEPNESEREKMSEYSWGIPVETFEPLISSIGTKN